MQTKTLSDTIIFIAPDEAQKNEIVVRALVYDMPDDYLLTIKLAEVVGQPIKSWKVIDEFSHGRVVAMQFEVYPQVDPLLPIPILELYPLKFISAMQQYARHLADWSARDPEQWSWFNTGQILIQDIITASYRLHLSPSERMAFESCLRYTLAAPGVYR